MSEWLKAVDALLRSVIGVGLRAAMALVMLLVIAGALVGVAFPKYEATALLQFPESQKPDMNVTQRTIDPKANVIELAAYKRVAASYESSIQLAAYLEAANLGERPGSSRLLRVAEDAGFWAKAAVPVLPFSRRDQREFGEIKEASVTAMLGLELTVSARTGLVARDMVNILASYYANAVVRERMRAWALAGRVESQSQEKALRADILRAELDIKLYAQRAADMKEVLARNPDAAKLDSRQMITVNPAEGGERYLSPLAQLVGAESAMSQRREMIQRAQRELRQKEVLTRFYGGAEPLIDSDVDVEKLLGGLRTLAKKMFSHENADLEWNREAELRINGALDNFEVMRGQFGVRNGVRVEEVASRTPWRLAALGGVMGLGLLGAFGFLRATMRAAQSEN